MIRDAEKKILDSIERANKAEKKIMFLRTKFHTDYNDLIAHLAERPFFEKNGVGINLGVLMKEFLMDKQERELHQLSDGRKVEYYMIPKKYDPPVTIKECYNYIKKRINKEIKLKKVSILLVVGLEEIIQRKFMDEDSETAFLEALLKFSKKIITILIHPGSSFMVVKQVGPATQTYAKVIYTMMLEEKRTMMWNLAQEVETVILEELQFEAHKLFMERRS